MQPLWANNVAEANTTTENPENSQPDGPVERENELPESQAVEPPEKSAQTSQAESKKGGKRMRRSFFEEVPIDQYSNLSIKVTELTRLVERQVNEISQILLMKKGSRHTSCQ